VLTCLHRFATAIVDATRDTKGRDERTIVEITFTFDRWEATSQSAWGWLSRRRDAASVLRVVNVETLDSKLHLECTVIGISAAAAGLKQREYASFPYRPGVVRVDDPEEEAEDFLADPEEDDPAEPF
jgi:hypothetical protein